MINFEEEIAQRDARIAELERQGAALAASYCDGVIGDSYGHAYCKYKAELAALKAQQPSAGVVDERAAFELGINPHCRRMNEHGDYVLPEIQDRWDGWQARAALSPAGGVVLPKRMTEEEIHAIDMDCTMQIDFALGIEGHVRSEFIRLNPNPAGSGVVLPERMTVEMASHVTTSQSTALDAAQYACDWYNRGLDEVARLNHCRAQSVPDGYVMVPVEPTQAMVDALKGRIGVTHRGGILNAGHAIAAAIAAAPSAKKES